jgi:hypothetical protein
MYLYRARQKILWEINNNIVETRIPTQEFWMAASLIIKNVTPFYNSEKRIARGLAALSAQGYIKYVSRNEDGSPNVSMTQAGLDALSTLQFKHLQHRCIANIIRDGCGLIVAIATIYTLLISIRELRQTQEDIKIMQEELHRQKEELTNQEQRLKSIEDSVRIK